MKKTKVAIYSCYIPYNEDSEKNNRKKLEDLKLKTEEQSSVEVIGIFEEMVPAKTQLADRPELQKLLQMARLHEVDEIIAPRIRHLSTRVVDLYDIFKQFDNENVKVICHEEGIDNQSIQTSKTMDVMMSGLIMPQESEIENRMAMS